MKRVLLFLSVVILCINLSAQDDEHFIQQFKVNGSSDATVFQEKKILTIEYDFIDHDNLKMALAFVAKKETKEQVESVTLITGNNYSGFSGMKFSQQKEMIKQRQLIVAETPTSKNKGVSTEGIMSTTHDNGGGISTAVNADGTMSTTHDNGGGIATTFNADGTMSTTHDNGGGIATTFNADGTISTSFTSPPSSSPPSPQSTPERYYKMIKVEVDFNVIKLTLTKEKVEKILASKSLTLNVVLGGEKLFVKFKRKQLKELQKQLKTTL